MALINGTSDADTLVGTDAADQINGLSGDDTITGGLGDDTIFGGAGRDDVIFNVDDDGADSVDLGDDTADFVLVHSAQGGRVRLTFTVGEAGNGNARDGSASGGQDGGLAVRLQRQAENGDVTGPVSRFDDEGMLFSARDDIRFDVRDLDGTMLGDHFTTVYLGSAGRDIVMLGSPAFANGGGGNDALYGASGADYLIGGDGNDGLSGWGGPDTMMGGAGDDYIGVDVYNGEANIIDTGSGNDRVNLTMTSGVIRLSFDQTKVGDGDSAKLGVRAQVEIEPGVLLSGVTQIDDEGVTITVTSGAQNRLDVYDEISGA